MCNKKGHCTYTNVADIMCIIIAIVRVSQTNYSGSVIGEQY